MLKFLRKLFGKRDPFESEIYGQFIAEARVADHQDFDPSMIRPFIIPASLLSLQEEIGPMKYLNVPWLGLAWCYLLPPHRQVFLDHKQAKALLKAGIYYEAIALENLRKEPVFSGIVMREEKALHAFMLHDDGLGPARLLLHKEILETFPNGYYFAVPERSCAIVFSADLGAEERRFVEGQVIGECVRVGTRPLSGKVWLDPPLKPF